MPLSCTSEQAQVCTLQGAASTLSGSPLFSDSARCSVWSDSVGRWCHSNVQFV